MNEMHPNNEEKLQEARHVMQRKARDHARTPMQWSAAPHGGFSPTLQPGRSPWMRVNDDYPTVNAEAQTQPPRGNGEEEELTVFGFWQRGLAQRKQHKDVFVYGDFAALGAPHEQVFAYRRWSAADAFVVVLNFSAREVEWEIPAEAKVRAWVAWNYGAGRPEGEGLATEGKVRLKPWMGLLAEAEV